MHDTEQECAAATGNLAEKQLELENAQSHMSSYRQHALQHTLQQLTNT